MNRSGEEAYDDGYECGLPADCNKSLYDESANQRCNDDFQELSKTGD